MTESSISDNIMRVRDAIGEAAIKSGRASEDITLVAAAKTKSKSAIAQAIAAGIDAVGENRVQEMLEKYKLDAYSNTSLHFIGHLQSNKVKQVVGICDLIESVSSAALITSIGKRAVAMGITQDVLLEVNIGKEPQKSGILPEQTEEMLELASKTDGIKVLGLMAVPPVFEENERNCYYFDIMFQLYIDMNKKKYDNVFMDFLSMGMSDSYINAILSGSNMVRIGTAIFGNRT